MTELWTFVKAAMAGLIVLGTEVALIAGLDAIAVPPAVSFAVVQFEGTALTFTLSKLWVFGAGRSGRTHRELARSTVVFAGSLVGNTALPSALTYGFDVPPVAAFLASQAAVYVLWNYPARRWWVFASTR
ncbi:MAG TPA: GtrA family protein [Kofleriaceae bacterium]|nr:GtrA family protein [Kofleriaceae bacterium]